MEVIGIWKPVGKEPSGLWAGEVNGFNDVFCDLAMFLEQHESYCYSFRSWDPSNTAVHSHSTMTVGRIARWLAYYGLLKHSTEKRIDKGNAKDEKTTLYHVLEATPKLGQVFEKGEIIKVARSYSDPQTVGIGKPYPSFADTVRWRDDLYDRNKVAQWRRAKWTSDFQSLFNVNVAKTREEMQRTMMSWIHQKIASIPLRGRKARVQTRAEMELNCFERKQVSLEGWQ